jgi:D-sedoheptulose 7-phosphate isomerase
MTKLNSATLLAEHIFVAQASYALLEPLARISECIINLLRDSGKILFCGNGGSAADAQHFAAELVGRFYLERQAIAALALTTDTSVLTCLSNDYHYDIIFARQLEALCQPGDVVVLLTTSGHSENILRAAHTARARGAYTVGLTGKDGGALKACVDDCLIVPSDNTPRIQEMHLFLGHTLCQAIEDAFFQSGHKG